MKTTIPSHHLHDPAVQRQPSEAALRAARAVFRQFGGGFELPASALHLMDRTIDRETGLPALLAAINDLLEQASRTDAGVWLDVNTFKDYVATVARAAIAACKPKDRQ